MSSDAQGVAWEDYTASMVGVRQQRPVSPAFLSVVGAAGRRLCTCEAPLPRAYDAHGRPRCLARDCPRRSSQGHNVRSLSDPEARDWEGETGRPCGEAASGAARTAPRPPRRRVAITLEPKRAISRVRSPEGFNPFRSAHSVIHLPASPTSSLPFQLCPQPSCSTIARLAR